MSAVITTLIAVLVACHAPEAAPARILVRTDEFVAGSDPGFSVAPDASRLLYVSSVSDTGAPRFVIVDLQSLKARTAEHSKDSAAARLLVDAGVWSDDSRQVFLTGEAESHWVLTVADGRIQRATTAPPSPSEPDPGVSVVQVSPTEIGIRDNGGRMIATHRVEDALRTSASAATPVRSRDGRWLAYVVYSATGSFVGSGTGYVVDMRGQHEPLPLSGNLVSAIRFDRAGRAAYAVRRAADRKLEILEWRLLPL